MEFGFNAETYFVMMGFMIAVFVGAFFGSLLGHYLWRWLMHKNDAVAAYRRYLSKCSIDTILDEVFSVRWKGVK